MYLLRSLSRKDRRLVLILASANLIVAFGLFLASRDPKTGPVEPAPEPGFVQITSTGSS